MGEAVSARACARASALAPSGHALASDSFKRTSKKEPGTTPARASDHVGSTTDAAASASTLGLSPSAERAAMEHVICDASALQLANSAQARLSRSATSSPTWSLTLAHELGVHPSAPTSLTNTDIG